MKRLVYFTFIFIWGMLQTPTVQAQVSGKLKEFLWQRDFKELIETFADEEVVLQEEGLIAERERNRSYVEIPGLRVQTFAGSRKEAAQQMAEKLQQLRLDSVYVVEEGGLYKVQIGNFRQRLEAEKMLDRLRFAGIDNAWIVQTQIHWPKDSLQIAPEEKVAASGEWERKTTFAIQIFVSTDRQKAEELGQAFSRKLGLKTSIVQQNGFWKVLAGRFRDEASARRELERIQSAGFPDAWVTQVQ